MPCRLFGGPDYEQNAPARERYDLVELKPVQRRGFDGSGPPLLIVHGPYMETFGPVIELLR